KLANFISALQGAESSGTEVSFDNYQSTSTNGHVARPADNIEFTIDAISGIDVKPFSHCPQVNELVLDWKSQFKVKSVTRTYGRWEVHLEQIDPSNKASNAISVTGKKLKATTAPGTPKPKKAKSATAPTDYPDIKSSQVVQNILNGTKSYRL